MAFPLLSRTVCKNSARTVRVFCAKFLRLLIAPAPAVALIEKSARQMQIPRTQIITTFIIPTCCVRSSETRRRPADKASRRTQRGCWLRFTMCWPSASHRPKRLGIKPEEVKRHFPLTAFSEPFRWFYVLLHTLFLLPGCDGQLNGSKQRNPLRFDRKNIMKGCGIFR